MRYGELIASLVATAPAGLAKLALSHSNLSALDRYMRTLRALAVIAVGLASFACDKRSLDALMAETSETPVRFGACIVFRSSLLADTA